MLYVLSGGQVATSQGYVFRVRSIFSVGAGEMWSGVGTLVLRSILHSSAAGQHTPQRERATAARKRGPAAARNEGACPKCLACVSGSSRHIANAAMNVGMVKTSNATRQLYMPVNAALPVLANSPPNVSPLT